MGSHPPDDRERFSSLFERNYAAVHAFAVRRVGRDLRLDEVPPKPTGKRVMVIVPVTGVSRLTRYAISEALSLMGSHRIRHLPVVKDGKTVGLISVRDLLEFRLEGLEACLLYTSPSPRDPKTSRMPSSA